MDILKNAIPLIMYEGLQLITESELHVINIISKNTCICDFLFHDIESYLKKILLDVNFCFNS